MRVLLAHNRYRSGAPSGEDTVFRTERALLEAQGVEVITFERSNDDIDERSLATRVVTALETTWSLRAARELCDVRREVRSIADLGGDLEHQLSMMSERSGGARAAAARSRARGRGAHPGG